MAKGDGGQGGGGGGGPFQQGGQSNPFNPMMQRMGGFQGGGSNMLGNAQAMNLGTSPYGPTGGMPGMGNAMQGAGNIMSRFGQTRPPMQQGGQGNNFMPPGQMKQMPGQFNQGNMGQMNPWMQNEAPGGFGGPSPDIMNSIRQKMGGNTGFGGPMGNRFGPQY